MDEQLIGEGSSRDTTLLLSSTVPQAICSSVPLLEQVIAIEPALIVPVSPYESSETMKKKLIIRLATLAENTQNTQEIVTLLVSAGMVQMRQRDTIMAETSDYNRTVEICKLILSKGADGFDRFVAALRRSGNDHLAEVLIEPLTAREAAQSFDECLLELDIARSPRLGAAKHEIESFNVTLSTTNQFHFRMSGMPGRLGISPILTEYTVENFAGKVLFFLLWQASDTGLQVAALRTCNLLEMCCPSKIGVTRICQNLIGNTIMEVNTDWGVKDVRVNNAYWGRIWVYSFSQFLLRFGIGGYLIMDRNGIPVYHVESTWSGVYKVRRYTGFNTRISAILHGRDGEMVGELGLGVQLGPGTGMGLKFEPAATSWLTPDDRMLLLGASIMILDLQTYDKAWTSRKIWWTLIAIKLAMIPLLILVVVIAVAHSYPVQPPIPATSNLPVL